MHVDAHLARTASAFGGLENSPRVLAKFRRSLQAVQAQAQAQATREPLRMNVVGTCFVRSWVFCVDTMARVRTIRMLFMLVKSLLLQSLPPQPVANYLAPTNSSEVQTTS